jgi:prophage DNA circulation protein
VTSAVSLGTQALANLKRSVTNLQSSAGALASAPSQLLTEVSALVEALGEAMIEAAPHNAIGAILKLYGFSPGVRPPATTPNREIDQANFDATQLLFQRLVLVEAARMAIEQTFASYDEAVAARASITDLIDEQAEIAADDTYPSLEQLRADLVRAVPGEATDLPRLIEHTPHATMPSLVVAYDLYGDLSKEADLLARNSVRHAGFITGGVTLEILSVPDRDTEPLTDG